MVRPRFRLLKLAFRLIMLAVLVAGWGLAALALHVVVVPAESGDGTDVIVIPKNRLGVADTYVDTRAWTAEDARRHEALTARLVEAGKSDRLSHLLTAGVRDRLENLRNLQQAAIAAQQAVTGK